MRWHVTTSRNPRKKTNTSSVSIFSAPTKARRRLQATEIYSKLYYKDRILPVVRKRLESIEDHSGPIIGIIREVTKELWCDEDVETRNEVAAKTAQQDIVEDDGEEDLQRTPQQYQE